VLARKPVAPRLSNRVQQEALIFYCSLPISSKGGDNNVPDPATSAKELPTFKFELEKSEGRVIEGSYGKEATVVQLPISKALAGVSMRTMTRFEKIVSGGWILTKLD
jgi:hypothetical protein